MTITLRTTYTINNGADQVKDLLVELPKGRAPEAMDVIELMSLAADKLVSSGQIMVGDVEVVSQAAPAAA